MGSGNATILRKRRRHVRPLVGLALMLTLCAGVGWASAAPTNGKSSRAVLGQLPARQALHVEVSLATGPIPGTDGLGYFLPELTRCITDGLHRAGLPIAAPGEVSTTPVIISVEERSDDRVVIVASARGQRLDVEGPVEHMEALVESLIAKLSSTFAETAPAGPLTAAQHSGPRPTVPPKLGSSAPVDTAAASPPPHETPAPKPSETAAAMTPPTPPPPVAVSPPTVATPAPAATATAPAASPPAPAAAAALTPISVPAPPRPKEREPIDPYGPDARVADPTPGAVATVSEHPGYVRGRVVVHTIPEPASGYVGAGSTATQALYAVLQRRLRLSVVPMGAGLTTVAVAADEGQRTQSRLVVMGRIDALSFMPDPVSPGASLARLRLEIALIRDGRLVLRRAVIAETPPGDPRRGRVDPVYLAVSRALDGMVGELAFAIGDAR